VQPLQFLPASQWPCPAILPGATWVAPVDAFQTICRGRGDAGVRRLEIPWHRPVVRCCSGRISLGIRRADGGHVL
jgi:hypothetical protein